MGQNTEILPKIHYKDPLYETYFGDLIETRYFGKCPDFKVGNKYYELEGFSKQSKPNNRLKNMLNRGINQSQNLIILEDRISTINHIKRMIFNRINEGQLIEEV